MAFLKQPVIEKLTIPVSSFQELFMLHLDFHLTLRTTIVVLNASMNSYLISKKEGKL